MLRRLMLAVAMGAAAALALACSSGGDGGSGGTPSPQGEGDNLTRTSETGGVTVEATWLTEAAVGAVDADLTAYPPDDYVLIELKLDTHSGDLNAIDLDGEATLQQDGTALQPEAWLSLSDDSHHREGVLVFKRTEADGPAELTVDIGDEQVSLLWEVIPA